MDDEIRIPIELPLDDDGFLRRECPNCEEQFKWHVDSGELSDSQTVDQYFCPLCGEPSGLESWWTPDQLEYARGALGPSLDQRISDTLAETFRGLKGFTYKQNRDFTLGIPTPEPLSEPNDMIIAEPPCHPHEPVKVPQAWAGQLFCLVCGAAFAV